MRNGSIVKQDAMFANPMQIDEQYHKQPLNQPELFTVDVQIREKKI